LSAPKAPATLRFEALAQGRLSITDPRGLAYVDTFKGRGAPLSIALLYPGRYAVEWGGRSFAITARGAILGERDFEPVGRPQSRGDGDHAFRQLFSHPHGPGVLRGFRLARTAPVEGQGAPATPEWIAPALATAGAVLLGAGAGLHWAAHDQYAQADTAAQVDIRTYEARGAAFSTGAAGAYALATGALVGAVWIYLTD
jgi:hypothetical protein